MPTTEEPTSEEKIACLLAKEAIKVILKSKQDDDYGELEINNRLLLQFENAFLKILEKN